MSKINLSSFDEKFLKTIKDYKECHINPNEGTFYTIMIDGKKVGVIGFEDKGTRGYFLNIGIHQDFRGQGFFEKAFNLLVEKHKIKKICSTIAEINIASIKAHKKICFKRISKKREDFLKEKGFLLKQYIRMTKRF